MPREDDVKVWMPLFVRDFLTDTEGLTPDEGWAYIRLLCHLWLQQGYLDDNPRALAQLGQVPHVAWPAVWRRLEQLFEVDSSRKRISQKRQLEELDLARERRRKKREAGQAGAKARWKIKRKPKAQRKVRSQCPSPSPSPSPSSTTAEGEGDPRARAPTPLQGALDAFCVAWKRRYGGDYAVTDRDRTFLGRVLKDLTPGQTAALPDCFSRYTRDEDRFLVEIQRHSLWFFCKQDGQNKYSVEPGPIRSEKETRTAAAVEQFINRGGIDGRQGG